MKPARPGARLRRGESFPEQPALRETERGELRSRYSTLRQKITLVDSESEIDSAPGESDSEGRR